MFVRSNSVVSGDTKPDSWGGGYRVVVYPAGAIVTATATATSHAVARGHSFKVGDYALVARGTSFMQSTNVTAVTATTVDFAASIALQAGDRLVNVGADASFAYTQSPMRIFSRPGDDTSDIATATVVVSSRGNYDYAYYGTGRAWELVLDSTMTPVAVIPGIGGIEAGLSPPDFGAQGDDSTDDQAAFNSMSLALGANGGSIVIPPQHYRISQNWAIDASNVIVSFDGGALIRPHSTASGIKIITVTGGATRYSNIIIQNPLLEDDDSAAHSGAEETHGIVIEQCDNVRIVGGKMEGFGDEAINLIDCRYFAIEGVYVASCGQQDAGGGNITLSACRFGRISESRIVTPTQGDCIRTEVGADAGTGTKVNSVCSHINVQDNILSAPAAGRGMQINAGSGFTHSINITNNTIDEPNKQGILIIAFAATRIDDCVVSGNIVTGGGEGLDADPAHEGAIDLDDNVRYCTVNNNVVYDWGLAGKANCYGIRCAQGGHTIIGNRIRGLVGTTTTSIYSNPDGGPGSTIIGNNTDLAISGHVTNDTVEHNDVSDEAEV